MKCLALGSLGAVLTIIAAMFVAAQYSDYTALSQSTSWMLQIRPLQAAIERASVANKALTVAGVDKNAEGLLRLTFFEVSEAGTIILRGGKEGQTMIFTPTLVDEKVTWRCVGGPVKAVPTQCRR